MTVRTVRHAFVSYWDNKQGMVIVPRGETADFPEEVIDRFEPLEAFYPEGHDPLVGALPGDSTVPFAIDPDADDEVLIAWLVSQPAVDIAEFVAEHEDEYPDLGSRVGDLMSQIVDERMTAKKVGGEPPSFGNDQPKADTLVDPDQGLRVNADGLSTLDPDRDDPSTFEGISTEPGETPADPENPPTPDRDLTAEQVVANNVAFVSEYLSRNPNEADAILEAEQKRADAAGEEPRRSVVRAAAAAIGHTQ